jgi:ribosomal peptide maturation radical SAM protein 1
MSADYRGETLGNEAAARVALVNMPWASVAVPPISLGILKSCLRRNDIACDILHLNIRFAELIGNLDFYEGVAAAGPLAELCFAPAAFAGGRLAEDPELARKVSAGLIGAWPEEEWQRVRREVVPRFIDDCLDGIDWRRYAIVGFTSTFAQHSASLLLARRIKERSPETKIVFGGANVTSPMGPALLEGVGWVDFVVDGEAEESFPALVAEVLAGEDVLGVPGVAYRRNGEVVVETPRPPQTPIDDIPLPDYEEYFAAMRGNGFLEHFTPALLIETSRGCWWGEKAHCTFCGREEAAMVYREKSPERALDEYLTLSQRYRVIDFAAVDNILSLRHLRTLLPALEKCGVDLRIFYEIKASLRREEVEQLRRSGVRTVQAGVESLSTPTLRLMRKGTRAAQNVQIIKWCREMGIDIRWAVLYGLPGEDPAEYAAMVDKLLMLSHCQPPYVVGRLNLQRYSPYHDNPAAFGIRDVRPDLVYSSLYPEGQVDLDRVAYYFDYALDPSQPDPEQYAAPVKAAAELWRKLGARARLDCWRGPGFLKILDRRPRTLDDDDPPLRRVMLSGVAAAIYEYCDQARSRADLERFVETRGEDAACVAEILDGLTRAWLLFRDDDWYVSLAVPAA